MPQDQSPAGHCRGLRGHAAAVHVAACRPYRGLLLSDNSGGAATAAAAPAWLWSGLFALLPLLTPQFLRFLMVGLLNSAFGYGLFALLAWLGLPYPAAIGLATLAGIAFNFQTTGRLVFNGAPLSRIGRFVAVYVVVYTVNLGGVALLMSAGLNLYLANALLIPPLALLAYLLQQKFVFAAP